MSAVVVAISSFIMAILKVLLPIGIVVLIMIAFKIIYRYRKYGKSEFRAFQKTDNIKFTDMIKCMINEINEFKIIIEETSLYSDLLVLSETGIYLIKIMKYQGAVTGEKNSKTLKNKVKEKIEKEVDNPFYYLENDKNILLGLDNNLQIKTILITNSGVNISIDNVSKNQIYNVANFYYMMENDLKGTKIYDKLYLESLAKLIKKRSVYDVNK